MAQLNWWMPIYQTSAESTIAFHPRLWDKAVANQTEHYEYFSHESTTARDGTRSSAPVSPHPPTDLDPEPEVRLVVPAAWLDDARAPDFARLVEIHRKPGYDPAELLFDPAAPGAAKRRAAIALARKKLGLRYMMNMVGLDAGAAAVRGTHGRLPGSPDDSPVLLCSSPQAARDRYEATEVKDILLYLAGLAPKRLL